MQDLDADALANSLELEGEGQPIFWIRRHTTNCCFHSFKATGAVCERVHRCLFCSAQSKTKKDIHYGLFIKLSVASLYVHATQKGCKALPDDKLFDFILEIDSRLVGCTTVLFAAQVKKH